TLATQERQLAAMPPLGSVGSWLENRQVPLGADVSDEPGIAELMKHYKDEVARLPPPPPPPAVPVAPGMGLQHTPQVGGGYVGSRVCATCHAPALTFWTRTKHAKAWQALVDKGQQRDAACQECHETGKLVALPDVQCEACHGPGAAHVAQPSVKGFVVR